MDLDDLSICDSLHFMHHCMLPSLFLASTALLVTFIFDSYEYRLKWLFFLIVVWLFSPFFFLLDRLLEHRYLLGSWLDFSFINRSIFLSAIAFRIYLTIKEIKNGL